MNAPHPENDDVSHTPWSWVAIRLILIFILALIASLVFYLIAEATSSDAGGSIIGLSVLLVLPYSLGAIIYLAMDPRGQKPELTTSIPIILVFFVLALGALFMKEGVICVAMLVPLWWLFSWFGTLTVKALHNRYRARTKLHSTILIILPFLVLGIDSSTHAPTTHESVERSIIINAAPQDIWPHLLKMDDISDQEGQWNITQSLLQVHRPRAAIVVGEGLNAKRLAAWGDDITFEEHISHWDENNALRWNFVFPNDSVHKYTDRHISPDGAHLKIKEGGYILKPISPTQTRLTLDTQYAISTPVNTYGALWGELILGDIQTNILHIVKDRSEH
ncbi:hypothetical protein [Hirschia litorea]|uniref:Polyketide cyclase / dehydrase and lipid transport n=1 Tax=Hirschia litorea TaxID=1199156 RepID=A0ABW2IKV6_9PROT